MTEDETVPAQSPTQADDAYLAACSALLVAVASNTTINAAEADALLDAMPDAELRDGLRVGLGMYGLLGS